MKEFEIIEKFFKPLTKVYSNKNFELASKNLSDDCAYLNFSNPNKNTVISKDISLEDIHFNFNDGAFNIASKSLLANLSDLSSSGAKPIGYFLAIGYDDRADNNFFSSFCQSLQVIQEKYNISLFGGDCSRSKNGIFISITIIGQATKGLELLRQNAQENDEIYVSGNIGDSFLGLKVKSQKLNCEFNDYFLQKHFLPCPKVEFAHDLSRNNLAKCAIDISDGLISDLSHICNNSNLSAKISLESIPFSNNAKKIMQIHSFNKQDLITGGEDFELIFTAKASNKENIFTLAKKHNLSLNIIGKMVKNDGSGHNKVEIYDKYENIILINKKGYEH